ncbi:MAG: hypothetical protein IJO93_01710 [Clostridia bacterium]|nr:hypothetical protein [Clostridia bacterium]
MRDALMTIAAVCILEQIFELISPDGVMKKQMQTVCGIVFLAVTAELIIGIFGR